MTDDEIRDAVRLMRWKANRADAPPKIWQMIADAEGLLRKDQREMDRRAEIERAIEQFLTR